MNKPYLHMINNAPSLAEFADDPDPERLVRRLGTASSGEKVMIAAALSFVPEAWLSDSAGKVPFRLNDAGSLDGGNTRALLEAVAIQASHEEALHGWYATR